MRIFQGIQRLRRAETCPGGRIGVNAPPLSDQENCIKIYIYIYTD